jgi:5-methyltetrahydropteroyltriglutamate--homocysteine methyltransferase
MPRSTNRILTTHVGSLIRPPEMIDFLRRIEAGQPYDEAAYEVRLRDSIATVVKEQADIGVDIVSDGEFSKGKNWAFYVHDRLTGMERRALTAEEMKNPDNLFALGGRDRHAFPEFYDELDTVTGMKGRMAFKAVCSGPIKYVGHEALQRDIANLKAAAAKVKVVDAFLPVVAPASAFPESTNEHYADERSYLMALAEALGEEYKAIVDAGLMVQIDDAFLPYMHEKLVPPMTLAQYRKWAELRVDALNHALRGVPADRSRYHICWGSWNGPHTFDVPMKDIVDLMLKVKVGSYQFEAANPRHEHEWQVWKDVNPKGKVLVPGVISHATNVVEHPELVAERIVRIARLVGRENVMGGTDCGFAQSPFARRVHPTIMWAKLKALAEGAQIATKALWGKAKSKAGKKAVKKKAAKKKPVTKKKKTARRR